MTAKRLFIDFSRLSADSDARGRGWWNTMLGRQHSRRGAI